MIGLLGISYKSADIEIRERFAFSKDDISLISHNLLKKGNLDSMVMLSTCNRTELYYHCPSDKHQQAVHDIMENLSEMKSYNDGLAPYFYFKEDSKAVRHLFRVVSGIESLIVGEDQIIGQVKEAFQFAEEIQTTDKIIKRLFIKSFEVGKKVRSETLISRGSASASSAAVNICHQLFPDLSRQNVMLIGAGQTGQLVLNSLRKSTFASLKIANRTLAKADELVGLYGGESLSLDDIESHLEKTDILFVATDSPEPLINKAAIEKAMKNRNKKTRPLYFDLSVPRNIESGVENLDGVRLYTIDDLQSIVQSTNEKRMKEIDAAMEIIRRAEKRFLDWKNEQELVPTIMKIKTNFHQLNQAEMEEFMKIRSIKDNELLNEYSKHITDKFARVFIKNLKNLSKTADKKDFIEMAEEFFEL
jgi:glutamyl-tRNA reductase